MKTQDVRFYVIKIVAFMVMGYLTIKDQDKGIQIFLVGFIAAMLIWEGIWDFGLRKKEVNDPE